jgi:hypothetical protein
MAEALRDIVDNSLHCGWPHPRRIDQSQIVELLSHVERQRHGYKPMLHSPTT